jgi:hypothetical protein
MGGDSRPGQRTTVTGKFADSAACFVVAADGVGVCVARGGGCSEAPMPQQTPGTRRCRSGYGVQTAGAEP